jgi:hypothetical protein
MLPYWHAFLPTCHLGTLTITQQPMQKDIDIISRLRDLHAKWYNANRQASEVIYDAIVTIENLRSNSKEYLSILNNPHAGVTGWGKGKDE